MMKKHHSRSYPLLSALLFFFFVSWSSSSSLLSIWLHQEAGLKATDTGIILLFCQFQHYALRYVMALFRTDWDYAKICFGILPRY